MNKQNQTLPSTLAVCLFSGVILLASASISSPALPAAEGTSCGSIASGCTVFTISKGGQVFFGGNDDYINPDSYYWVDPGDEDRYGAIWIGMLDNVQQGVKEIQ
jgi:hypothetical protein